MGVNSRPRDVSPSAGSSDSVDARLSSPDHTGDTMNHPANPERYEVRVRGLLGETLLGAFPGLHSEARGGDTVLIGVVRDQAALHGVLAQVEALGLELLEVRRNGSL